ncbi:MAG: prolyl oligopeptidase family serine peptidase [Planctomycetaceae bacterium]|nr:prolyl oligopeptidase family serine peptidase [Planctomycetaceae bacterium]
MRRWLSLDPVDRPVRHPFNANTVLLRHLLDRDAPPPAEGEVLEGTAGEAAWKPLQAAEDGAVPEGTGTWFSGVLEAEAEGVFLAHLVGASSLFVEGAGFPGDVYGLGSGPVPVFLRKGANRLLVAGPRGKWSLRFERWEEGRSVVLPQDATLPDAVAGTEGGGGPASVRVVNPSPEWAPEPWIAVGGFAPYFPPPFGEWSPLPLAPLWTGKAALDLGPFATRGPVSGPSIGFSVAAEDRPPVALKVPVRSPGEARRVTFLSRIDGSVQYFGYLPEAPPGRPAREVGTVLSLHGAGVDALDQARSYAPKPDFRIVAPTNRRPFGFDWQDWGREDAMEALSRGLLLSEGDPSLVFLTGHSMGGHGAWHLAANDPDSFAAVAPSAGWCSFDTYAGGPRPETELSAIWRGADGASRTEDLVANLVPLPIFVLHGAADDNVPLSEAEGMIRRLEAAGGRPRSRFVEGAGHWWDLAAGGGADCVDWPGIFDLFRRSRVPEGAASLDLVAADPSVDALHHGTMVFQPLVYGRPFRLRGTRERGRVVLDTENVRCLSVLPSAGEGERTVILDGREAAGPGDTWRREGDRWIPVAGPDPAEKSPGRSGPFKRVFDRRFVLVVPTAGTAAENRESLELARFHATAWWYRANGSAPVVRDVDLLSRPAEFRGRNLVLYGNADVNAAWDRVFRPDCPVKVRRGEVRVGDRSWKGGDLGAILVHPRAGEEEALAGAFASTGDRGTRVGYGLLPFTSGVGYPDWVVYGAGFLRSGDGGVRAAGWFDHRWGLQPEGAFHREEQR